MTTRGFKWAYDRFWPKPDKIWSNQDAAYPGDAAKPRKWPMISNPSEKCNRLRRSVTWRLGQTLFETLHEVHVLMKDS